MLSGRALLIGMASYTGLYPLERKPRRIPGPVRPFLPNAGLSPVMTLNVSSYKRVGGVVGKTEEEPSPKFGHKKAPSFFEGVQSGTNPVNFL